MIHATDAPHNKQNCFDVAKINCKFVQLHFLKINYITNIRIYENKL